MSAPKKKKKKKTESGDTKGRSKRPVRGHPREENGTHSAETISRCRAAVLGDPRDDKYKGKPRPQSTGAVITAMEHMGYAWHLFLAEHGIEGFFDKPPSDETEAEADIRIRVEQLALGMALFSLAFTPGFEMPDTMAATIPHLRREHRRMQAAAEGQSFTGETDASVRRRAYHYRQKEAARGRKWDAWNTELHALIKKRLESKIADSLSPATPTSVEEAEGQVLYEQLMELLTPAEHRAMERKLSGQPAAGEADQKAYERAAAKLRRVIEAERRRD
jgi:hypothetical protein